MKCCSTYLTAIFTLFLFNSQAYAAISDDLPVPRAQTLLVSKSHDNQQTTGELDGIKISADGRYVVFASADPTLVPNDTNGEFDIFVRDLLLGTTERVSVTDEEFEANARNHMPVISADGRYIAFQSVATNMDPSVTVTGAVVYVRDREEGTTKYVGNLASFGGDIGPAISSNGRYIAYCNYEAGDIQVFLFDRETGETELISVAVDGVSPADGGSTHPYISFNGRYVVFQTGASDLVPNDTNGHLDVFLRDRQSQTTERLSVKSDGSEWGNSEYTSIGDGVISDDGRYAAFYARLGAHNQPIFIRDRAIATTTQVTWSYDDSKYRGDSSDISISSDGRYIAYKSSSTKLVTEDDNNEWDVFLFDRVSGATSLVSVSIDDVPGNGYSGPLSISSDGKLVAFASYADDLVTTDTNLLRDAFVRNMDYPRFVALGDSYASGTGAKKYGDTNEEGVNECHRSENVWSGAKPGGTKKEAAPETAIRHNLACHGARTINVSQIKDRHSEGQWGEPLQIEKPELADADIVTVLIGGNDAHFKKVLWECLIYPDCASHVPELDSDPLSVQVQTALEDLKRELPQIYSEIKNEKTPLGTKIFAVNYPRIFEPPTNPLDGCYKYDVDEINWMNESASQLSEVIKCAAAEEGIYFMDVQPQFERRGLCGSGLSYLHNIEVFNIEESFHPQKNGQIAYADALEEALKSPYKPSICAETGAIAKPSEASTQVYTSGYLEISSAQQSCSTHFVAGQTLHIEGSNFLPTTDVHVIAAGNEFSEIVGSYSANESGHFNESIVLPITAPTEGFGFIKAVGLDVDGSSQSLYGPFEFAPSVDADADSDGIPDLCDICPDTYDPSQIDSDQDGVGDICDSCALDPENDLDEDGICGDVDVCPSDADNDSDGDGLCQLVPGNDPCLKNPSLDCVFESGFESP